MDEIVSKTKEVYKTEVKENNNKSQESVNTQGKTNPDGLISVVFFILITTIFTIVTYITLPDKVPSSEGNNNIIYLIIYILVLVVGNYFINLNLTKAICGGQPQWANTMIITLVPWILIFGVINVVLIVFPGWLSPFANTFGYLFMNLLGVETLLKDILNLNKDSPGTTEQLSNSQKLVARGIEEIYSNSSLFLNQIPTTPESFTKFVTVLINTEYFKKGITIDSPEIGSLYKFIQLKEIIGKYFWNILSGILVTSVSFNYILNTECSNSLKSMIKNRNNFLSNVKEKESTKSKNRVYYPFLVGDKNDENVKSSTYSKTDD